MTLDPEKRRRVLAAAAEEFAEHSVINASKRDVAKAADVPVRSVTDIAPHRIDLLRQVVADLPFPPVAESIARQAAHPSEPALQALLRTAREVLGDPGAAWDPLELQAIIAAPYDEPTREVVADRLSRRWAAALEVVRQLRGANTDDEAIGDDAAALHLISVGLGLALLAPLSERWSDARSWTALTARLLETLAADDVTTHEEEGQVRWRARVTVPAAPSSMAQLLRMLSQLRVRVVSVFTAGLADGRQQVDMFLASPPDVDRATIVHGISSIGSDVIVARGREEDAGDVATRVLHLSARLVQHPEAAPQAVADLVLADSWEVATATVGEDSSDFVLRLQWTPERHVILRRVKAPFTRTERNRAGALLALIAAMSEALGDADGYGWRENLADGRSVAVRLGRPEDTEGVERMHERCSPESRYQRYFTPMNEWRQDNLRRISGGHRGATLVVTDERDEIIALGNVFPIGPEDTDVAEIAVIVDDAWHGRGVGLLLTRHLIDVGRRLGFDELVAYVLADNRAMRGLLEATGLQWRPIADHGLGPSVIALTAPLAPDPVQI
jgi:RimJ/RimL family protein N-acetyltransferase/AcrR family transcriptional regulator